MANALLTCTTCNNIFRSRSELNYHVKRHHQSSVKVKFQNGYVTEVKRGDDDTFKCNCGKPFKLPGSVRRHARSCRFELAEVKKAGEEDVEMSEALSDPFQYPFISPRNP